MGIYDCQECGSPLMPTMSGSVCSGGCGKLQPKLPRGAAKVNEAKIAGAAEMILDASGRYRSTIDGELFEKTRPCTVVSKVKLSSRERLGLLQGKVHVFIKSVIAD
ncbi:unnamed protein product [marine sediment metagenome]|uniref:Uncharacterized protein n=1 Tax=marine sediment metagenome TaxID=412755 RepID=X0W3Y1_9ZZZZ